MHSLRLRDNTYDSRGTQLLRFQTYLVPDEVSAEDAEILVRRGKAEAIDEAITVDALVAAINQLDKGNTTLWTDSGKPRVDAIEAVLGKTVTAVERDTAWAVITGGDA